MVTIKDINNRVLTYEDAIMIYQMFNETINKYGSISVFDFLSLLVDVELWELNNLDYRSTKNGWTEMLNFKKHFKKKESYNGFISCKLNLPNFKEI